MNSDTSPPVQYTWAGRFSEPVSDLVKRYTASVDFDQRMWRQDIRGSLAHARMLARQNIISAQDFVDIERGMVQITKLLVVVDSLRNPEALGRTPVAVVGMLSWQAAPLAVSTL